MNMNINMLRHHGEKRGSRVQTLSNPRVHYLFFAIFIIVRCLLISSIRENHREGIDNKPEIDNALYFYVLRVIYEIVLLRALRYNDPYGFYIAILILIQHVGVAFSFVIRKGIFSTVNLWTIALVSLIINTAELLYLLLVLLNKHSDINQFLYRLTGSSPSVNKAHATRMLLNALGTTALLIQCSHMLLKIILFREDIPGIRGVRLFCSVVSVAFLLFVFANLSEEIPKQRIVAIIMMLVNFIMYTAQLAIDFVFAQLTDQDDA